MSRTVVIPCASSSGIRKLLLPSGSPAAVRCTCMSASPGIRNFPLPSTMRAPRGTAIEPDGPTAAMRCVLTRTSWSGRGAAPAMSTTVTCTMASAFSSGAAQERSKQAAASSDRKLTARVRFKKFLRQPRKERLLDQPIVFFQNLAQFVMRKTGYSVVFYPGHGPRGDHGIDDGFFGCLDGCGEKGIQRVVGQKFQVNHALPAVRVRVGGGKRDKDIARSVTRNASIAAKPQRNAPRDPLQLLGKHRRIGGHHHNDRSALGNLGALVGVGVFGGNLPSHRNPRHAQILPRAVVALHQYAHGVAAILRAELP